MLIYNRVINEELGFVLCSICLANSCIKSTAKRNQEDQIKRHEFYLLFRRTMGFGTTPIKMYTNRCLYVMVDLWEGICTCDPSVRYHIEAKPRHIQDLYRVQMHIARRFDFVTKV